MLEENWIATRMYTMLRHTHIIHKWELTIQAAARQQGSAAEEV